jgi:predicted nucleic acid-binding protein
VTEVVLDASVVLKWFRTTGEHNAGAARAVRTEFEAGQAVAFAPPLLFLEILNIAGCRWRLPAERLKQIASTLPNLGFQLVEPDLAVVASWIIEGLTAYDAAYVPSKRAHNSSPTTARSFVSPPISAGPLQQTPRKHGRLSSGQHPADRTRPSASASWSRPTPSPPAPEQRLRKQRAPAASSRGREAHRGVRCRA